MLATVEEVLQTMTDDDIVYDDNYPAQFLIDNDLRIITVPSDGVVLGVENDKDVNLVKFKMPRFYKKQDLSTFNIKVIFENANKELGYYIVPNKEINEDSLEFGWLLDHTVTAYKGAVRFIVYLSTLQQDHSAEASTDGAGTVTSYVDQAFNTTIGTANVLEGLSIDQEYAPGQVEDILSKLQQYADQIINKVSAELTTKVNSAVEQASTATEAANEAVDYITTNLYPVADNILKGTIKDTFIHVDDAFPSKLLVIEVEGATEQVTSTGKNLLDCYKLSKLSSQFYAVENGNLKILELDHRDWDIIPTLMTMKAGTYCMSGASIELHKASDNSVITDNQGKIILDEDTEVKVKVGTNLSYYPSVVKAQIQIGDTATAYEPYTEGKLAPSPRFPQEINVIENPVVKVTGRNLAETYKINNLKQIYSAVLYIEANIEPSETYMLSFDVDSDGNMYASDGIFTWKTLSVKRGRNHILVNTVASLSKDNPNQYNNVDEYKGWICLKNAKDQINEIQISNVQLERASACSDYAPYTSQSFTFTLPAEHPFLAKVYFNTSNNEQFDKADEITVDRDGNVSLIANIGKYTSGINTSIQDEDVSFGMKLGIAGDVDANADGYLCKYLKHSRDAAYYNAKVDWLEVDKSYSSLTTIDEVREFLNGKEFFYLLKEPKTYPLGKIEMPKLQDNIANVWTDAEVTPNTSIKYIRDVNIVVSNLETAIASITEG